MTPRERCRSIVESEILGFGHALYGWRQVPTNNRVIGDKANATRPEIEQVMITNNRQVPDPQFELDLYVIRRRIEKQIEAEEYQGFLHLFAVLPLDRLQGPFPGRAADSVLSRPAG